jgi:hypothetical protein
MTAVVLLASVLSGSPVSAIVFKSQIVRAIWDNWCYYDNGTYYLYYLITEHSGGEGFGVATSADGVHWLDHGWAIRASDQMVDYLGTGAVWKSADFGRSGRFLCNYSEWRKEPGTGRKTQNILFAWSTDLIHWTKFGDESMFKVDQRYYDKYGRWDCIFPLPRAEGGYWGTWTATARPGAPGGIVGLGYSDDGLHWTALPPPQVLPGVGESGAFWKFGSRVHAMFGAGCMWNYSAEQLTGPYKRTARNAVLLPAEHTYFSRFFPLPDGTVLVNHQSNSDWGWHVAALKQAVVDAEGVLRLKYWPGNEALKGKRLSPSVQGASNAVVMMTEPIDILAGFVAEGTVRLQRDGNRSPTGFYLLPDNRGGHAIRLCADGQAEFGTMDPFGGQWQCVLKTNRDWKFGPTAGFRLLVRRGMAELYLDDYLVDCYHLRGSGGSQTVRLGVLGDGKNTTVDNLEAWQMSLPGKVP